MHLEASEVFPFAMFVSQAISLPFSIVPCRLLLLLQYQHQLWAASVILLSDVPTLSPKITGTFRWLYSRFRL